ncbi:MAG: hypothetical protein JXR18_12150 [Neptuniibacter sp.]
MNTAKTLPHNDEIDLFQLLENIWKEKILIIVITLIFALSGLLFAFTSTPVYQASAELVELSPETQNELKKLSLYSNIINDSPLLDYRRTLSNSAVRAEFIEEADTHIKKTLYPSDNASKNLKALNQNLKILDNQQKKNVALFPYTVQLNAQNMELSEQELNRFLSFTSHKQLDNYKSRYEQIRKQKIQQLEANYLLTQQAELDNRKNKITRLEAEYKLAKQETKLNLKAEIESAKLDHQDRLLQLSEALTTANALKIAEPINIESINSNQNGIRLELNNSNSPLYTRGSKLLNAEIDQLRNNALGYHRTNTIRELQSKLVQLENNSQIEQLKSREDDLPFSEELQSIKLQLQKLNAESFPDIELSFAHTPAVASPDRLKPKRALILALSIILGGITGIIIALIRSAVRNRRNETAPQ